MREPDFDALATRLLRLGIAPRHVHRTVNELRDHYDDLVDATVDDGISSTIARSRAAAELGGMDVFAAAMASRRELKTWAYRYPHLAVVIYPLACLVALPTMPIFAGIAHRQILARWGVSLLGAGLVTAAMLLVMQLTILLG